MIATLNGIVAEKINDIIVVECAGVGYGVLVSASDYGRLNTGQKTKLYVYEHIREQQHDLFGFVDIKTKKLFEQLLGVNGVGPKMALNILSIGTPSDVCGAIAQGNLKFIQQANGVGKRVAERLVVDLKDKIEFDGQVSMGDVVLQSDNLLMQDEAVQALTALGYTPQDAAAALKNIDTSLPVEDRIKAALKG